MKSKCFLLFIGFSFSVILYGQDTTKKPDKTIFVTGGSFGRQYVQYLASLTNKPNPKICFVPTASADNAQGIANWYATCEDLAVKPYVLRTFINSNPNQKSFEEIIMSMDAIVVGGGNTLNMIAIWKAQGIDTVLKKAYDKGIIMSGGATDKCPRRHARSHSRFRPERRHWLDSISSWAWRCWRRGWLGSCSLMR